jgi:hypothetical protein
MVPKVAAKGTSFKGAGLYYLHDKDAKTAERVAFTHTENLATNDPDLAIKMMAHTAINQNRIKAANGGARTGRKLTFPVYTYSLSWAPGEQPTQEQMIEAGQQTLKELGLDGHEVLMVAHNDEPHPHIHLIVNRVHPQNGKAAALSNDHLNLSRWAEGYEREQGKIRCEQRVLNNEARRRGQFVKDRRSLRPMTFHQWRRQRGRDAFYVRQTTAENLAAYHAGHHQALRDRHAAQRDDLYDKKEERIRQFRAQLRNENRPEWAALYRQQRQEKRALNVAQRTAYSRLRYYLEHRGHDPQVHTRSGARKIVTEAVRAVLGGDNPHGALSRKHERERAALAKAGRTQIQDTIRDINQGYRQDLKQLTQAQATERRTVEESQKQEQRTLEAEHTRQSQQRARDIKEGRDRQQFREEVGKDVSDEFARRVRNRLDQMKKRREAERRRGKGKGRERE